MLYKSILHYFDKQIDLLRNKKTNPEEKRKNEYKALAYYNVFKTLANKDPNTTAKEDEILAMPLTAHMKNKILMLMKEPSKYINKTENYDEPQTQLYSSLLKIMGMGKKKASQLIDMGLTSISQLKSKKYNSLLNDESITYLKYNPLQSIPRHLIEDFEKKCPSVYFAGSYRRGKSASGDIDIITTKDIDKTFKELNYNNSAVVYKQGEDIISFLFNINSDGKTYVQVDLFYVAPSDLIPMLTYATGPKKFNVRMRGIAKRMGYKLNQKGLYHRDSTELVKKFKTEKDLFNILKMDYLEPKDRL
jgi:DNA polymerase/3'-5' exonuclease PolX